MNQKKANQRVIGGSLIALAVITGVYQYQFSKVKTDSKEEVIVATKDILTGDELTRDNVSVELRDRDSLSDGTYVKIDEILGSIAKNNILKKEMINEERIVDKTEYEKLGMRLVSIKGTETKYDTFSAYEVKPNDIVDVLFFNEEGVYDGQPYIEGITVTDIKSAEGISYTSRGDGFIPCYATMWLTKEQAQVVHQKQEAGGYVKLVPHRDRGINTKTKGE